MSGVRASTMKDIGPSASVRKSAVRSLSNWLRGNAFLWLVPGVALMIAVFIRPILLIVQDSFTDPAFGIENYRMLAGDPLYRKVMWNSVSSALQATLFCILIGYPAAYAIYKAAPKWRQAMLIILLFSFAVGTIPRAFSWLVILGDKGLINTLLFWLTGNETPLHLLYNQFGVVVGMVHVMLPYIILILLGSMMRVGTSLVPAARTLGARPLRAFFEIFLPLTMPGVVAGAMLVFVYSLGFYLVPAVLGGASQTTVVMQIESLALRSGLWGLGASLSTIVIIVSIIGASVYVKMTGLSDITKRH